jgi:hypothetical protein
MINPKLLEFKEKVASDPRWTERAILAIFKLQTPEEQQHEQTVEHNNIGFTGADGEYLSSLAKQLLKGYHLSTKQLAIAQHKMPKYAGQLCDIAGIPRTIKKVGRAPRRPKIWKQQELIGGAS